jgi:hypothetical protein
VLRRILRAAVPILLVMLGIGSVVYGVRGHVITVVLKPEKAVQPAATSKQSGKSTESTQSKGTKVSEDAESSPPESEAGPPPGPDMGPPPGNPWMSPPSGNPWMGGPPRDPWMSPPPPPPPPPSEEPAEEEKGPSDDSAKKKPTAPAAPAKMTSLDLEPVIIRDVTVGGLSRSVAGEIIRAYVVGGKTPALCPT